MGTPVPSAQFSIKLLYKTHPIRFLSSTDQLTET